ncbi:MAG TPA: c-type cytochrome [Vicinamibacterales bacterium]|nr:c-type cytochrome [Vicinamibacterales bacterium]
MGKVLGVATLALAAAVAAGSIVVAQGPAAPGKGTAEASPYWAYGVPPPAPAPAPGGAVSSGTAKPTGVRPPPDTSLKHVPDSTEAFTMAQLRDFFNVADWFPGDHPPMPDVVVHGRAPDVRGCGMCHMPNGLGRPENAPIAGLPYAYVVQQLTDFKNDLRTSAEPRKTNTAQMIQAAKAMTDEEVKAAATYLSALPWKPWIKVVEADTIPRMRLSGNVFFSLEDGETEPIGDRIVETPLNNTRFELRDPHSGFTAYVPKGSLKKGAALVASGGSKTLPCGICHGHDLQGLGPVPGIAGRSPSYIVRQLYDIQQGTRKGTWSPLMKQVVDKLTQHDMIAIAAYVASK